MSHSQARIPDAPGPGVVLPPGVWSILGQVPKLPCIRNTSPSHPPAPAPKSNTTKTHIARPGRLLYRGNFCRCFLFIPQDVTPGISAIGKVETGAQLVVEPCPLKQDPPLCLGQVSVPLT